MRLEPLIGALLAASLALGCASHDDQEPASAAGQPGAAAGTGAGAGAASAGAMSEGGASSVAGAGGHAGAASAGGTAGSDTGGVDAGGGFAGSAGTGGAAADCPLPLTVGDHSHLTAQEQVGTYAVSGSTAQQLRQSMNANRGHDFDALTTWNIAWGYQNCASPVWTVSLNIVYDLPEWDVPPAADPSLVASWDHYITALDCHEYGHGKLGLDCANSVYDALAALPATGDCDALSMLGKTTFQGLLDQCKAREVAYDADTMHGASMGAVFPPAN